MDNLCETCLSTDRRLFHLGNLKNSLQIRSLASKLKDESKICWECKRSFIKIQTFREQALKARRFLNAHAKTKRPLTSLSTLTVSHKDTYDEICLHTDPDEVVAVKIEPLDTYITPDIHPEINPNNCQDVKPNPELITPSVPAVDVPILAQNLTFVPPNFDVPNSAQNFVPANFGVPNSGQNSTFVPAMFGVPNSSQNFAVAQGNTLPVDLRAPCTSYDNADSSSQHVSVKSEPMDTSESSSEEGDQTPTLPGEKRQDSSGTKPTRVRNDRSSIYVIKEVTEEEVVKARNHQMSQKRYIHTQYKCETCILGFLKQKNYLKHMETKHTESAGEFSCKICSQRFKRSADEQEHYREHYRFYRCRECDFCSPKLDLVDAHYEAKHDTERVYSCLKCDMTFKTRRKKKTHTIAVHRTPVCPECNKGFSSSSNLKKHLLTHVDLPRLECPTCHKMYKTESTLGEHMRTHAPRTPDDDAYCAECDVRFANRMGLYSHMKISPRHGALRYECDHCGKRFTGKYAIEYHMEREHLRILKYECEHCRRKFASHTQRRKHINKVHKKKGLDERTACDICGKIYANPGSCKKHKLVHTGEKPYGCPLCPMAFSQRCVLRRHLRGRHKLDTEKERLLLEASTGAKEPEPVEGNVGVGEGNVGVGEGNVGLGEGNPVFTESMIEIKIEPHF